MLELTDKVTVTNCTATYNFSSGYHFSPARYIVDGALEVREGETIAAAIDRAYQEGRVTRL